jgi:hypothetical protein
MSIASISHKPILIVAGNAFYSNTTKLLVELGLAIYFPIYCGAAFVCNQNADGV